MNFIYRNIIMLFIIFTYLSSYAATVFTSNGTGGGEWSNSSSWLRISGDIATVPDEDDDVTILANDNITISSSYVRFSDLTVNLNATITVSSGAQIRAWKSGVTTALVLNGTISGQGQIVNDSRLNISGSGSIGSSIKMWVANDLHINSMNLEFANEFKLNGNCYINTGSNVTFSGTAFSTSVVNRLINVATLTISTSNFFITGSGSTSQILECNNYNPSNSNVIYTLSGELPLSQDGFHDLTINGTVTSISNFSITGDFLNSGSFTSSTAGNIVTFNGSSDQTINGGGVNNFKNLLFSNSNSASKLIITNTTLNIEESIESSSGILNQNGGNIILKSSSSSSAGLIKVNSSSDYDYDSGTFTCERFFNASSAGWRMIASPLNPSTLADWDDEFYFCGIADDPSTGQPAGINNYSLGSCSGFYSVLTYNESAASPSLNDGFVGVTNLTESVANGLGSLIYSNTGPNTISVTGTPNFSIFNKPITKFNDGWNLVANPYPSTLDWTNGSTGFYDINSSIIDNARYIYQGDLGNYTSGATDIPHSQGFWVKASNSGNLSFNPNQTINSFQTAFTKSSNGVNKPLKLFISSDVNSYGDYASVLAGPNYSNNYDQGQDIFKLFSPNPDYVPNIYFLDNNGNFLDRTCINNNQSEDLFLDARIGQYAQGNFTIDFDNIPTFMIGSCIILEDLHNGVITDLRTDSSYTFISDSLAPSPRFRISINVNYDINVTNSTCFQDSTASIAIEGSSISGSYFNLYDSLNNLVDSIVANQDSVSFTNLNSGEYNISTNHNSSCSLDKHQIIILEPDEVIANFSTYFDTLYLDSSGQAVINFTNLSMGASIYEWDFGDGNISNEINPYHTYTNSGIYDVQLISKIDSIGNCYDISQKSIIVQSPFLNINNSRSVEFLFKIHGNTLNIESHIKNRFIKKIFIFSISGQLLYEKDLNLQSLFFNLSEFSSGCYLVKIEDNSSNKFTYKFIK